jgi:hypothetical protein
MPYAVKKLPSGQFATVKKATGKILGRHPSRLKAQKQIEAIYANSPEVPGSKSK